LQEPFRDRAAFHFLYPTLEDGLRKSSERSMTDGLSRPDTTDAIGSSFEEVVLPHLDAGYRLARWLMRNEHDAEDVVQEASLRAFRYFDEEQHHGERPPSDPETLLLQTDNATLIERAMNNLPDRFRQLLVLRELEGLSYLELAIPWTSRQAREVTVEGCATSLRAPVIREYPSLPGD
jgi:hypothetical protein